MVDLASRPTQQLAEFMDDADSVWTVDGFSDPDE